MKGPKIQQKPTEPRPVVPITSDQPLPHPIPETPSVSSPQQPSFLTQPDGGLAGSDDPIAAAMAARQRYENEKTQKSLQRQESKQLRLAATVNKAMGPKDGPNYPEAPTMDRPQSDTRPYRALQELKKLGLGPAPTWARPFEELGVSKEDTMLLGWVPERGLSLNVIASASRLPENEIHPRLAVLAQQGFVSIEGETYRLNGPGKEAVASLRDRGNDVSTRLSLIDAQFVMYRTAAIESGSITEWNQLAVNTMLTGGDNLEVQTTKVALVAISACELMGDLADPKNAHVETPQGLRQLADAFRFQVVPEIQSIVTPDLTILDQSQAVFDHIARLRATESSALEAMVTSPETYREALEGIRSPQTRTLHALAMASYQALDAALPSLNSVRTEASGSEAAAIGTAIQRALYGTEAPEHRTFAVLLGRR